MSKTCTQLSFPSTADAEGALSSSGVSISTDIEVNVLSWTAKVCFCFPIYDQINNTKIYVQRDVPYYFRPDVFYSGDYLVHRSIIVTGVNSTTPAWLDEDNITNVGDKTTEVFALNGAGPWKLKYPNKYKGTEWIDRDVIGKLQAITKTGAVHSSNSFFDFLYLQDSSTIKLKSKYETIAGVIVIEYTIGGKMAYMHFSELFFRHNRLLNDITSAQWEYSIISPTYGLLGNGSFSVSGVDGNVENINVSWGPIPAWTG